MLKFQIDWRTMFSLDKRHMRDCCKAVSFLASPHTFKRKCIN